jgi:hypothetical protein
MLPFTLPSTSFLNTIYMVQQNIMCLITVEQNTTVHSLIKLNATITSRLLAGAAIIHKSLFCCFHKAILDLYLENLVVLGSDSCSCSREVTAAFNFHQ